jgi:hypothetical protein
MIGRVFGEQVTTRMVISRVSKVANPAAVTFTA